MNPSASLSFYQPPQLVSSCPSLCQEGLLITLFLCVHSSQYDVTAPTPYWPPAGHWLPEVGRELPAGWAAGGGDPAPAQVEGCLQADAQPVIRASRLSFPASSFLGCISSLHHLFLQPQPSARLPFVVLFLLLAQRCGWCSRPSFFTYAPSFFPAYGPHTWFFLLRCLPALTQRQSWVSIFFSVPHTHHVWSVFLAPISHHSSTCLWVLSLTIFFLNHASVFFFHRFVWILWPWIWWNCSLYKQIFSQKQCLAGEKY